MRLKSVFTRFAAILGGSFLLFLLIEAFLRLGGYVLLSRQARSNRAALENSEGYRILCLGESTTQGQYPAFLEIALNRGFEKEKFVVIDEGRAGSNSTAILARTQELLEKYHPDMVIAMMGMNDPGEPHLLYEEVSSSAVISLLKSLRTYKLFRLLFRMSLPENSWKLPQETGNTSAFGARTLNELIRTEIRSKEEDASFKTDFGDIAEPLQLGRKYLDSERYGGAQYFFDRAVALSPSFYGGYIGLGLSQLGQGSLADAKVNLEKALALNPKAENAYVGLANLCILNGKVGQAEMYLNKALALNPINQRAAGLLVRIYNGSGRRQKAEEFLKTVIGNQPYNPRSYLSLSWVYSSALRPERAESVLLKSLELNPSNSQAYLSLGILAYGTYEDYPRAEKLLREAVRLEPWNYKAYVALEFLLQHKGSDSEKDPHYALMARRHSQGFNLFTARSYNTLKTMLDQKNIRLVCSQYPMRSVASMKKMFANPAGVIFIDNEGVFKKAVRTEGLKRYFRDMCGIDFGHCTEKGNKLLAENIAKTLLIDYFAYHYEPPAAFP